jgi:hypothetical protein
MQKPAGIPKKRYIDSRFITGNSRRATLRVNYLCIATGIVALVSLFLPWFSIELWTENLSSNMSFSAYLFQLTGTVVGVTKSIFLFVWFNSGALILMTATGAASLVAGVTEGKKRRMLVLLSLALGLSSLIVFAYGLATSDFALENLNPGYTISQFPVGTFRISAEQSMQNSYDYSWAVGSGFWLATATAALALISTGLSRKR